MKPKNLLYQTTALVLFLILMGWNSNALGQTTVAYETPGDYEWTVPPGVTSITVKLWGGGGGSGGHGTTTGTAGGAGGITTFGPGANLSAGGGGGSAGATTATPTNGGVGGIATGGSVNTNGFPGTKGITTGDNNSTGGDGGASPNGGATQPGPNITGKDKSVAGINGNVPGGGAAGSARSSSGYGGGVVPMGYTGRGLVDVRATGGGGGGAYVEHSFTVTPGEVFDFVVGAGGTAGTGGWADGGAGAAGKIAIEYTDESCTAPTFTLCPGNITQEADAGACHATVNYTVTATGTPAPSLTYVFTGATTGSGSGTGSGSVFNVGPTNVTITASNDCEPNAICSFMVSVTDNQPPVVSEPDGSSTVSCLSEAVPPTAPTAQDNCDGTIYGVLVGYVDTPNPITCEGTRVYTYSYSNIAGMPSVSYWTYTYTIEDTEVPVITLLGDAVVNICQGESYTDAGATANDNCNGDITDAIVVTGEVISDTPGTYTLHYNVIDGCGNFAIEVNRTVIVKPNPTLSVINVIPSVVCVGEEVATLTITGLLDGDNTINYELTVNGTTYSFVEPVTSTGGTFSVLWNLAIPGEYHMKINSITVDGCTTAFTINNEVSWTVFADPAAPTAIKSPNTENVCTGQLLTLTDVIDSGGGTGTCNIEYSHNGAEWTTTLTPFAATVGTNTIAIRKNCDGPGCEISPVNTYSWTVDPATVAGNVTGGTTVCEGSTSGLLTLEGYTGSIVRWESSVAPFDDWTSITNTADTYTSGALTTTTQFRAVVKSGVCDEVASAAATVTVLPNTAITGQPSPDAQNLCVSGKATLLSVEATGDGLTYQWYSNTSNSNVNGTLINDATSESYIPSTTAVGTLYYYVVVSGTCGTATSNVSGAVNVEAYPEITIPDDVTTCDSYTLPAIVGTNLTGNEAYYTATGGNGTKYIEGEAITSTVMLYLYDVTANGCWDEENFLITINTSPICSIEGTDGPVCPGASIVYTAPEGMSYAWSITGNGSIQDPSTGQTVTVTAGTTCDVSFTLTLNIIYGNGCSSNCEKTVSVNDTESPVVNATNGSSTIACLALAVAPTVPTATDNCSGIIEGVLESTVDDPDPLTCEGSRVYTYSFTDDCDNVSYWTYTYTIEYENFTMPADAGSTVACESEATEPTPPEVTDNCGNTITPTGPYVEINYSSRSPIFCEGTIAYIWTYVDCAGNSHDWTYTYTIEVLDFIANMPENDGTTVACASELFTPANPTVYDNCSAAITDVEGPDISLTPDCEGDVTYTWTYTDCSGNFSHNWTYTFTIEYQGFIVFTKPVTVYLDENGYGSINFEDVNNGSVDNCIGPLTFSLSRFEFGCSDVVEGGVTVTLYAEDCAGNTNSATAVVTVIDEVNPEITCAGETFSRYIDPYQTYYTVDGVEFDAEAEDACGIQSLTYFCATASETIGTSLAGVQLQGVQNHTILWTAVDVNGNESTCTTIVTVVKRPTTLTYTGDLDQQYSDPVALEAKLVDNDSGDGVEGKTITFTIGTQSTTGVTDATGVANATLVLTQNPAITYTVKAEFIEDASYLGSSDEKDFDITQEDAYIEYVGLLLVATPGSNISTATVNLMAVIQDNSILDDDDEWPGDIRNATVQFKVWDLDANNLSVIMTSPIINVNDMLIPGEYLTGIVSWTYTFNIGNNDSKSFGIEIIVNNYYTGHVDKEDLMLTVYKPQDDFITGGGNIWPQNPEIPVGLYPSDPDTRTNFGFMVKYNKPGTSLKGKLNFIWRTENGRIFQARSNAIESLGVNINNPDSMTAVFVAKCNVRDLSPNSQPIPNSGGVLMYVTMVDQGEPGSMDLIGFTLWNENELWYSSNWTGMKTEELNLAGGNLVVHSGFNLGNTTASLPISTEELASEAVGLGVFPNPATDRTTFRFVPLADGPAKLEVFDITGSQVTLLFESNVSAGQLYEIEYLPNLGHSGMLLYRMILGDRVLTGKLLIQR